MAEDEQYKAPLTIEDIYTPSFYGRWTEGTVFAPWIPKAMLNTIHFGAPFNFWSKESSLFERVMRVEHIGVAYGGILGFYNGMRYGFTRGIVGTDLFKVRRGQIAAAHGFVNGMIQVAAFPIVVTGVAAVRQREERAFDWFLGGMAIAAVHKASGLKLLAGPYHAQKLWVILALPVPFFLCLAKYLQYVNVYDDPKSRHLIMAGGPQAHNTTEMKDRYGMKDLDAIHLPATKESPKLKEIRRSIENRKLLFLYPRVDKNKNDYYSNNSPLTATEEEKFNSIYKLPNKEASEFGQRRYTRHQI